MLFRRKIQRSCSYCQYGTLLEDGQILCVKKGICTIEDQCRRFKYDPCKRTPKKLKAMDFSKYDGEDYSL